LSEEIKSSSLNIFKLIGQVESGIHGIPLEKIHFHEIGAVDSITDIITVCACFDMLKPAKVFFSKLPMGGGTIKSAHGPLPLPAPASSHMLKGIPVYGIDVSEELVTPTGAAIVKTFADGFIDFPSMTLEKVGTGLGKRKFGGLPGILRIFQGKTDKKEQDNVYIIEANIDDYMPEFFGHIFDVLLENGALDVTLTPVIMKKGRPGQTLSIICNAKDLSKLNDIVLCETSTIGIRYYPAQRKKLAREIISVKTPLGRINVKKSFTREGARLHPEYEDLKKIAKKRAISIGKAYTDIIAFLNKQS